MSDFDSLRSRIATDPAAAEELKHLAAKWRSEGVDTWAFLDGKDVTLSKIKVDPDKRSSGLGTKTMKELIRFAGKHGFRILLSPSTSFGATSVERLERFYSGLGFKKNAGRKRDFTTRETMIWTP